LSGGSLTALRSNRPKLSYRQDISVGVDKYQSPGRRGRCSVHDRFLTPPWPTSLNLGHVGRLIGNQNHPVSYALALEHVDGLVGGGLGFDTLR
jgi:hypothetical protein